MHDTRRDANGSHDTVCTKSMLSVMGVVAVLNVSRFGSQRSLQFKGLRPESQIVSGRDSGPQ